MTGSRCSRSIYAVSHVEEILDLSAGYHTAEGGKMTPSFFIKKNGEIECISPERSIELDHGQQPIYEIVSERLKFLNAGDRHDASDLSFAARNKMRIPEKLASLEITGSIPFVIFENIPIILASPESIVKTGFMIFLCQCGGAPVRHPLEMGVSNACPC